MRHYAGDTAGAEQAWLQSLAGKRTAWALRNLGVLALEKGQVNAAVDYYREAVQLAPDLPPLAVECGKVLLDAQLPQTWLDTLPLLSPALRNKGRIRLLEARATLALGLIERTGELIETLPVIEDIREGELSLSDLWREYSVQRLAALEDCPVDDALRAWARHEFPLPERFDFRMADEAF